MLRIKKKFWLGTGNGSRVIKTSGTPTKENIVDVRRRNLRNSKGQFGKGTRHSPATEFKKGDIPFNKGLKQIEWMPPESIERTKATRFKPGEIPPNAKPLGYISHLVHKRNGEITSHDWFINVNWRGERRNHYNYRKYLWEKFYCQDAPDGMIFVSKNGDQSEVPTIENIEMIDRAEHMRRNNPRVR